MKISGFTMVRNAEIYDFQVVESIKSILGLVDEFIVVVGKSEDNTRKMIEEINDPKIKIIDTIWDFEKFKSGRGSIFAFQTDIALKTCSGDWCFYLQADEVIHEKGLPLIREACLKYLDDKHIDGFLLKYTHFYGDYDHYIDALHFAYPREIRIVRNNIGVHSWRDAQSFRVIENFDGKDYWQKKNTRKLNCILLDAQLFHYGWCRDPRVMSKKLNTQNFLHVGEKKHDDQANYIYGGMRLMPRFNGTHPAVMQERISRMDWSDLLKDDPREGTDYYRKIFSPKYRVMRFVEKWLLNGRRMGGFKNYHVKGRFK